jgi:hypothetical protein
LNNAKRGNVIDRNDGGMLPPALQKRINQLPSQLKLVKPGV